MSKVHEGVSRSGLIYGVAAYGLWGVLPLYFRAVRDVPPLELLAHRIVWSVVLLAGVIWYLRRWGELWRCLSRAPARWMMAGSTVLIAINWFLFIYGVSINQIVQNSLGYFINPLLNILIGVLIFHERLRPAQWAALGLAAVGLAYLIVMLGEVPWIALGLASSFALYGLLRKLAPVESLVGLTAETVLLAPAAALFLLCGRVATSQPFCGRAGKLMRCCWRAAW